MTSTNQNMLGEIQTDIKNAKKRWKYTPNFESQIRNILLRLHVLVNNQSSNLKETLKTNLPPELPVHWFEDRIREYYSFDEDVEVDKDDKEAAATDEDFRIKLGEMLKTILEQCEQVVTKLQLALNISKKNDQKITVDKSRRAEENAVKIPKDETDKKRIVTLNLGLVKIPIYQNELPILLLGLLVGFLLGVLSITLADIFGL